MASYSSLACIAVGLSILLLLVQFNTAFATTPNYGTDRQLHSLLVQGSKGTVLEVKSTLTNQVDVAWAKSYIAEMVLTWDSFTDSSVGAGWVHMRLNNDNIQSTSAVYYHNANTGTTGLTFFGDPSGSSFTATTLRGTFDSANNCWNWFRTVATSGEDKCIADFDNGYAEVWSTSASNSNTFGSGTEYSNMQYKPNGAGGFTNWNGASADLYCSDNSPFVTAHVTNWNAWNVSPPGSGTPSGCSGFTSPKPLP